MKRYFLLAVLLSLVSLTRGNVLLPTAKISEVLIDSLGNWTIELGFYDYDIAFIDSIRVESSTGSSIINSYILIPGGGFQNFDSLSVITNANLFTSVSINPAGDYIKIISYSLGNGYSFDYVAIGNWTGSVVDCMRNGESVSYLSCYFGSTVDENSFCIAHLPTIGLPNDTTGATTTFSGTIYNLSGSVFTEGWFAIPPPLNTRFNINPDGSFSGRTLARRITFDTIRVFIPATPSRIETYTIEPINVCLRPDSSCQVNIITTSLVINSIEQSPAFKRVTASPNPFTDKITFYLNLKSRNRTDEFSLEILTLDGKQIYQVRLPDNQTSYEWTPKESIPSGVLIYQLILKDRCIDSGKLIKL